MNEAYFHENVFDSVSPKQSRTEPLYHKLAVKIDPLCEQDDGKRVC
jgi:hypothetical protein